MISRYREGQNCSRKVVSGRRVTGAVRSIVNARDLQLKCARVFYETLLVPVVMYGRETMLWKERERFRMRAVQPQRIAWY